MNLTLLSISSVVAFLMLVFSTGDAQECQFQIASYDADLHMPDAIVSADFNGDGFVDVAIAQREFMTDGGISISMNNGDGTFGIGVKYFIPNGAVAIAAGDVDGDSDIDLLYSPDSVAVKEIVVLRNNGNGTFVETNTITTSMFPHCLVLQDVDEDGDLDLIAASRFLYDVNISVNLGGGAFAQPDVYTLATGPQSTGCWADVVDVDGDAIPELVATNEETLYVFSNIGNGDFGGPTTFPIQDFANATFFESGDLDGDGDSDLVIAKNSTNGLRNPHVMLNDGGGSFAGGLLPGQDNQFYQVSLADFDGDGDLDISGNRLGFGGVSVNILRNSGNAEFDAWQSLPIVAFSIDSADFNNDGTADLVTAFEEVTIGLSQCFPLGDVNRDGEVNLLDVGPFVELLAANQYQVEADINQDGSLNLLDVCPFIDLLND